MFQGEDFGRKTSVINDGSGGAWLSCDGPYHRRAGGHPAAGARVRMFSVRGSNVQEKGPAWGNIGFTTR